MRTHSSFKSLSIAVLSLFSAIPAFAAQAAAQAKTQTLWTILSDGGIPVIFLGLLSVAALASIIYHFMHIHPDKLVPKDFTDNLLFLLEKKEFEKAKSVCKQQDNLISGIALRGLERASHGKGAVETAIQFEGRTRIEKIWQNLTYLGDMAIIAPMLGLVGTIFGMIEAFNFFKGGVMHPGVLTAGLAKAMINTAIGLVIAVPCLVFYAYFRGRVSAITSTAEGVSAEIVQAINK